MTCFITGKQKIIIIIDCINVSFDNNYPQKKLTSFYSCCICRSLYTAYWKLVG